MREYTVDKFHTVYCNGKKMARFKSKLAAEYAITRYKLNDEALKNQKITIY